MAVRTKSWHGKLKKKLSLSVVVSLRFLLFFARTNKITKARIASQLANLSYHFISTKNIIFLKFWENNNSEIKNGSFGTLCLKSILFQVFKSLLFCYYFKKLTWLIVMAICYHCSQKILLILGTSLLDSNTLSLIASITFSSPAFPDLTVP